MGHKRLQINHMVGPGYGKQHQGPPRRSWIEDLVDNRTQQQNAKSIHQADNSIEQNGAGEMRQIRAQVCQQSSQLSHAAPMTAENIPSILKECDWIMGRRNEVK